MVRLIIILVLVLGIVGGGTYGAAMFIPRMVPPIILETLGIPVPEPIPEDPNKRPEVTQLIDLEPMTIPLFRDGDVQRFLVIHILIEVEPGENFERVNTNLVRIMDAYILYIHALNALDIRPGIDDRKFLKDRLLQKTEEIVGKGVVVDLLFQAVFERDI